VVIENVDQLSPGARQELLRAMQDRLVTPLGTADRVPFAARIIATTRLDMAAIPGVERCEPSLAGLLSRDGALPDGGLPDGALSDGAHIRIAGLSERAEDIEPLVGRFMREFAGPGPGCGLILSPAALDWLRGYDWPENIAELKRLVSHLVASGHQRIGRIAVERILAPNLSPWVVDHRVVEQTRFPGFGAHRLGRRTTCSAAGSGSASCRRH
jgi:DNA-binding NtrC family response regulator